eukprot:m.49571 g.49571  ORF g.49571 m.49571 type:complete len:63 (+) comp10872_c1_seq2:966-1154(+)
MTLELRGKRKEKPKEKKYTHKTQNSTYTDTKTENLLSAWLKNCHTHLEVIDDALILKNVAFD